MPQKSCDNSLAQRRAVPSNSAVLRLPFRRFASSRWPARGEPQKGSAQKVTLKPIQGDLKLVCELLHGWIPCLRFPFSRLACFIVLALRLCLSICRFPRSRSTQRVVSEIMSSVSRATLDGEVTALRMLGASAAAVSASQCGRQQ